MKPATEYPKITPKPWSGTPKRQNKETQRRNSNWEKYIITAGACPKITQKPWNGTPKRQNKAMPQPNAKWEKCT